MQPDALYTQDKPGPSTFTNYTFTCTVSGGSYPRWGPKARGKQLAQDYSSLMLALTIATGLPVRISP